MNISASKNDILANTPPLNRAYTSPLQRANRVTVLGSSREKISPQMQPYVEMCFDTVAELIRRGYDAVTGCGKNNIMGAAYNAARENSVKDENGKPLQNLAIVKIPSWPDEDLENCIPIGKDRSEAGRMKKFMKVSDNFLILPGGETSFQELTSLPPANKYMKPEKGETFKKIFLIGEEYWEGMIQQYKKGIEWGNITTPFEKIFKVLNTKEEILKEFPKLNRLV